MKTSLSPRELADAVGVSESSLKRWADEGLIHVTRTAGGHRRITIAEAIRYIRQSGLQIANPEALGISDVSKATTDTRVRPDSFDQPLVDAIFAGHAESARGLVVSMYLRGRSVAEICDGPLTRAMHAVGDLWKHSQEGILIEHRATDVCAQALNHLRSLFPPPADDAPAATGATPAGDPYLITSLMSAAVLAAEGWRENNLGPDVPLDLLVEGALRHNASLVWLSVCVEQPQEKLASEIVDIGNRLAEKQIVLAVGGRMLPARPLLVSDNVNIISSMSELAAFARGLRGTLRKSPTPAPTVSYEPE